MVGKITLLLSCMAIVFLPLTLVFTEEKGLCFLMRFLNHHYTHNSDVTTCACLKRTPRPLTSPTMARVKQMAGKSTGGAPPRLHLATKAAQCTSGRTKGNCHEKASPLVPRNGGSKGDLQVPKNNRFPHQESPFLGSSSRDPTRHVQKK